MCAIYALPSRVFRLHELYWSWHASFWSRAPNLLLLSTFTFRTCVTERPFFQLCYVKLFFLTLFLVLQLRMAFHEDLGNFGGEITQEDATPPSLLSGEKETTLTGSLWNADDLIREKCLQTPCALPRQCHRCGNSLWNSSNWSPQLPKNNLSFVSIHFELGSALAFHPYCSSFK